MRVAKILELFFTSKFVLGQMNLLNITLNVKARDVYWFREQLKHRIEWMAKVNSRAYMSLDSQENLLQSRKMWY